VRRWRLVGEIGIGTLSAVEQSGSHFHQPARRLAPSASSRIPTARRRRAAPISQPMRVTARVTIGLPSNRGQPGVVVVGRRPLDAKKATLVEPVGRYPRHSSALGWRSSTSRPLAADGGRRAGRVQKPFSVEAGGGHRHGAVLGRTPAKLMLDTRDRRLGLWP